MTRLSAIYGFPVSAGWRFRLGGKKYRLGMHGVGALTLLGYFVEGMPYTPSTTWLLPYRGLVRKLEHVDARAALTLVVDQTKDERVRCLAIWLRGRCGGKLGATTVAHFGTSSDRAVRKEVVRCLKRLSAWSELRMIASTERDPQIRRMAQETPPKPYPTRLASFVEHLPCRKISSATPLFVGSPEFDLKQGRPPKSRWVIRMILERIHRLVTGPKQHV